MPTANDIHDLVAPYALDALDEEERAEFERHLAGCGRCTRELAELQDTAASLAWAVEGPEPPGHLRDRILESARREAQVIPFRSRRRWVVPALGAAAAAAACLAVGLGIWAPPSRATSTASASSARHRPRPWSSSPTAARG